MNSTTSHGDCLPPSQIRHCDPDQYLFWCRVAINRGAPIPPWTNAGQFNAIQSEYPKLVEFITDREREQMGIVNDPFPLDSHFIERLLITLERHPIAVLALSELLQGVAT